MFIPLDRQHFSSGDISFAAAVKIAYEEDLDWIESMLRSGLSVRVIAEKSLSLLLYMEIRKRLKQASPSMKCVLVQSPPSGQTRSFMNAMVENLWEKVNAQIDEKNSVIVLPHLDLLVTTTEASLNNTAREAIAAMGQDPSMTFLAFSDPALKIPQAIEELFDVHRELIGIRRELLPRLITYEEAQRFGVEQLNLYRFYKYVSGLHAIKLRKLMTRIREFPPLISLPISEREVEREKIERTLREMTLLGGMEIPNVDLDRDIGGYENVKKRIREELLEILALREDPKWATMSDELEETLPRGILFYGPPGTGKTYFAKAIATALHATTIVVNGPEIKSKWVGESEANLRRIFAKARLAAPSLIIFDEIDAIAPQRGLYRSSGAEHSLVNQLLTEMDGFRKEEMVFIVGTTNLLQSVDPALLRPGRFEYLVSIPYPDKKARRAILTIYARRFHFSIDDKTMNYLVERTSGYLENPPNARYSGDHLYGIMRNLKRLQVRLKHRESPFVITPNLVDEILGQPPLRSPQKRRQQHEKAIYHEAAHALLAASLLGSEAIAEVTLNADHPDVEGMIAIHNYISEGATKGTLINLIRVAFAGRAAEELLFDEIDVGAKNDLDMATHTARLMIEELGMSETLGPRIYRLSHDKYPLTTEKMREKIDEEIDLLLKREYEQTKQFIQHHLDELELLVSALKKKETLTGQDIADILKNSASSRPPTSS